MQILKCLLYSKLQAQNYKFQINTKLKFPKFLNCFEFKILFIVIYL